MIHRSTIGRPPPKALGEKLRTRRLEAATVRVFWLEMANINRAVGPCRCCCHHPPTLSGSSGSYKREAAAGTAVVVGAAEQQQQQQEEEKGEGEEKVEQYQQESYGARSKFRVPAAPLPQSLNDTNHAFSVQFLTMTFDHLFLVYLVNHGSRFRILFLRLTLVVARYLRSVSLHPTHSYTPSEDTYRHTHARKHS